MVPPHGRGVRSDCYGGITFLRLMLEASLIVSAHLMIRMNGGD